MRASYTVDEFIGIETNRCNTLYFAVGKKISLLYDFCILCYKNGQNDVRENAVDKWLSTYQTETQLDNAIHPILVGDITLNDVLTQKGFM